MARLKIRLSFRHVEFPKSTSFITHLSFSGSHGFRIGNATSSLKTRIVMSTLTPRPVPTANSFKNAFVNLAPGLYLFYPISVQYVQPVKVTQLYKDKSKEDRTLQKVIEGTRNIQNAKKSLRSKTPHVIFQFLVVKPNEHQIPEVYRLAKELDVDQVVLKTAQIYNYENGSPLIPKTDRYSRYRKNDDGSYSIKNKLDDHCWKMWHSCVVTWDGKVVPCCFDKDAHHVLGDLEKNSFEDVWNSDAYNKFRNSLLRSRSEIDMCRNCTEGGRVFA